MSYAYNNPNGVEAVKKGFTQEDYKTLDFPFGGKAPELKTLTSLTQYPSYPHRTGLHYGGMINTRLPQEQQRPSNNLYKGGGFWDDFGRGFLMPFQAVGKIAKPVADIAKAIG